MVTKMTKISEFIKELEKIKNEHGDLPVKVWNWDDCYEEYYLSEADYPEYYKSNDKGEEECVIIGE